MQSEQRSVNGLRSAIANTMPVAWTDCLTDVAIPVAIIKDYRVPVSDTKSVRSQMFLYC